MLAHNPAIVGVGEGAESRRSLSAVVSANYFDVLGVPLARGRTFSAVEDRPGEDLPVVITTWTFWQRRGFDPDLLGSTLRVNERPYTVIGITPRGFSGTMSVVGPELFFPLGVFHRLVNDFGASGHRSLQRADAYGLFLVGRLNDGVTVEAANARLALVGESLARAYPAEHGHHVLSLALLPKFGTSTSPSDETALSALGAMMMGMTMAVLLTVCLNLASMLFARGRARRKEFAVRLAVGGGRGRIVRQLLVEGFVLSAVGGALGIALGLYAVDAHGGLVDAGPADHDRAPGDYRSGAHRRRHRLLRVRDRRLRARARPQALARRHPVRPQDPARRRPGAAPLALRPAQSPRRRAGCGVAGAPDCYRPVLSPGARLGRHGLRVRRP